MRILAAIQPPEPTVAILACLGLPVRAPPIALPRPDDAVSTEYGADAVEAPPSADICG